MIMKKHLLTLAVCLATLTASATVIVDETFTDFPAGWNTSGSVTTPATAVRTQETALTYSNAGGTYVLSGQGNSVKSAFDASSAYFHTKQLPDSITSGTFYLSFIYRADGQQKQSQAQIFGLSTTETSAALRLWVGKDPAADANKCRMGITRASGKGADVQWGSILLDINTEHLIVIKYSIEDSLATLYVNPTIEGTEPTTAFAIDGTMGVAKNKFKYMCLYATGNTKTYFTMSGVRVSTTWAEAVASGTAAPGETPDYANSLFANFTDSLVWVNPLEEAPVSGSFPSETINDYVFTATALVKANKTLYFDTDSLNFVKFHARAHMDKSTYNGSIETPWLASIDTLYLYCNAGSDGKDVKIQTRVADGNWTDFTTFTNMKTHAVYAFAMGLTNVKIRIANTTTSSQYFFYIGDTNPRAFAEHTNTDPTEPTGLMNFKAESAVKTIENGQIVILKNGKKYNLLGAEL